MMKRRESGTTLVEFLGVSIVIVIAMLAVAQVAIWVWSRNVAIAAAHEGARTAAEAGRPLSDGQVAAQQILQDGVGSRSWNVSSIQSGSQVSVLVRGQAPVLIPILPAFSISARAIALDEDEVFSQ